MGTDIGLHDIKILKTGRLEKTGEEYSLAQLSARNIDQVLALQDVAFAHLTGEENVYLAAKDRGFFEKHFDAGNEVLGIVHNNRLIAQAIIVNPTPARPHTGIDMQIDAPLETIAVLQGAIVDPAYRGNSLQGVLVDERLALSAKNGRTEIFSEVALSNSFSWSVLLQKGLHIACTGISPYTGAEVYVLRGRITSPDARFDENTGKETCAREITVCPQADVARQKQLLAAGYKGTRFDRINRTITFQRLARTMPAFEFLNQSVHCSDG